ncbi:MAG: phosphoribosylformylglycinamidine synthase subunit PurL [Proteobacteria bacterium]|nr:phosphoribosylformylglycinamidine synthase subunit PurL [Pseudomonadota bacterium]MDA1057140.1 phosphoribosylformylglycinamidine synthase subunit PurL [Pseudomonadota bacterium]
MQNLSNVTVELAAEHGLTGGEFARAVEILGRTPNFTELGIFSVMWSEHCSYKSSKKWLRTLPTEAPWVICGPGENAGVIDIGDGLAAIFKMESHNHPSYIEPYQGAATGVGGILRDVFTMGARPIANLNALRFGSPDHAKTRHLVSGVVAGIGGYGNCIGVPTVGGECTFHTSYDGNILVNAMTVGIAPKDNIFYAAAAGIGNPVIYVGSKTGRDGIHGATMASAEFDDQSDEKRPTVQVGDPFTEKLLLEACLELMATDAIVAIQDMGAAGLTSSSFEMASRGGMGIDLDLDQVPMRETGMTAYELMLSESQERMLIVLRAGREDDARAIFEKWELDFAVIGRLTDSGRMVLKMAGDIVADLPVAPLAESAPEYDRPHRASPKLDAIRGADVILRKSTRDALLALMGSPDLCSKRWIWEQYDHMVMADTVVRPGADAAVVRIHGSNRALAMTTDCTPRYVFADPVEGGKQAVAECWRNLSATGAKPLAITDCLNFGSPEREEVMGQFVGAIAGIGEASRALDFPIVSGNVSFYNETNGVAIQPTPSIGGVGLIARVDRIARVGINAEGLAIILLGQTVGELGASLYLREINHSEAGAPPPVDLAQERQIGEFVRSRIESGDVRVCHDVSDGGLGVAVAEMVLAGGVGVTMSVPNGVDHGWWFGEDQARYILAVDQKSAAQIISDSEKVGIKATRIGTSGGSTLDLGADGAITLSDLRAVAEGWLPGYMNA